MVILQIKYQNLQINCFKGIEKVLSKKYYYKIIIYIDNMYRNNI